MELNCKILKFLNFLNYMYALANALDKDNSINEQRMMRNEK